MSTTTNPTPAVCECGTVTNDLSAHRDRTGCPEPAKASLTFVSVEMEGTNEEVRAAVNAIFGEQQ